MVPPTEAPSPGVARVLRQEGLVMDVAGRRAWILVPSRPVDRRAVFLANYWPVIGLVLERYVPAAIVGASAVRLHLGDFSPPEYLPAYQAANQSEYTLPLEAGFALRLRPRPVDPTRIQSIAAPGGVQIPVLGPAHLLATLDEPEVQAGVEPITAWLRHLILRTPDLDRAVTANPRPQVLQRLADMAKALGNTALAKQLDAAARRVSERIATPSRTGVGGRIAIPPVILSRPRGSSTPWLDEQAMRLERQAEEVTRLVGKRAAGLPSFSSARLLAQAQEVKAYDAYHSTTMEGYRISADVVEAIINGQPLPGGPQDAEALRAAMAVQGYSIAFDRVLQLVRKNAPLTGGLILDLYEDLFRPSVDAGIVRPGELRGWRTSSVSLKGWRHVPPNALKVPDLIDGLEAFVGRADLSGVTRALIAHLEFVTIHPFLDGNGRLGRLLLNLVALEAGLPWVTVRSDERAPFFRSIERAQVDQDTEPYVRFLWHLLRQAATDLEGRDRRGAPRRRVLRKKA
ncbi:MAG: Fic family protein [Gemmatimonadales bacterium]|nr:Fic family protein [Gemmatimonadales bacterium]